MRRFAVLLAAGALGMVLGTRVLVVLSPRATTLILGAFVLCFVALSATGFYKLVQLGAVSWYGLLPWSLLWPSLALTAVGLAGFAVGLRVQDRLDQRGFNRAVLGFLALLGPGS